MKKRIYFDGDYYCVQHLIYEHLGGIWKTVAKCETREQAEALL